MPRAGGRPRGSKDRATPARRFAVKFERGGWFVQQGKCWRRAREVSILAGAITSPSGVLYGSGVVTRTGPETYAVTP